MGNLEPLEELQKEARKRGHGPVAALYIDGQITHFRPMPILKRELEAAIKEGKTIDAFVLSHASAIARVHIDADEYDIYDLERCARWKINYETRATTAEVNLSDFFNSDDEGAQWRRNQPKGYM